MPCEPHNDFREFEEVIKVNKLTTENLLGDFSRFHILMFLYERPRHGYGILNEFKKRLKKEVSPSLVYPFLQKLQDRGLARLSIKRIGKKEKKEYSLTEEGKDLCEHLFRRFAALVSAAIEPGLTICANCGCKVYDGGHTEIIGSQKMVFCCSSCANAYKLDKGLQPV
ncbi:MAG: PadR family transcriptional regulator [Candidatus Heimdallarchaeota archaeon]